MERIEIRESIKEDEKLLANWLSDKETLKGFPLFGKDEIDNSVSIWMSYIKYGSCLTILYDKVPCGSSLIYTQRNKKLKHQALFAIVIKKGYRGKGIGTFLLKEIIKMAKEKFFLKYLHLEAYENNPAISLYKRFNFIEYGFQKKCIKEEDGSYRGKLMMQKTL